VFVVFLLHHLVDGWALLLRGSRVSMGPLSIDTQPPPPSADSAWFLTQKSGFAGHDDGRRNRAPTPNLPGSSNRKPQRNSDFDFHFCGFKDGSSRVSNGIN